MNFRTKIIGLLIVAVCGPTACEVPREQTQVVESVVHRGNGGEPGTLDPAIADDIHAFRQH